jgi:hypothetical protein
MASRRCGRSGVLELKHRRRVRRDALAAMKSSPATAFLRAEWQPPGDTPGGAPPLEVPPEPSEQPGPAGPELPPGPEEVPPEEPPESLRIARAVPTIR